jgi:hypothetical protein
LYEKGFACSYFYGEIGTNSCIGYAACNQYKASTYEFTIGDNSCRYKDSCEYLFVGVHVIGSDSCNGECSMLFCAVVVLCLVLWY